MDHAHHGDDGDPRGQDELLQISTVEHLDALVLEVLGQLDTYTGPRLQSAISAAMQVGLPVVVDLTGLTFFGSAGIGVLAAMSETSPGRPAAARLRIVIGDNPVVIRPIEAVRLDQILPIYSSVAEALAA